MQQRDSKGLLRSPLQVHAEGLPQYALYRLLRALYPRRAYYKNPSTAAGRRYIKSTMSYNGNLEQDLARLAPPSPQEEKPRKCSECQFERSKFMTYEYEPHAPGCSRDSRNIPQEGEGWEERLENEFNWKELFGKNSKALSGIKSFIRSFLASRDAALMGEMEKLKIPQQGIDDGRIIRSYESYNEALDAAIALVGSKQEKK